MENCDAQEEPKEHRVDSEVSQARSDKFVGAKDSEGRDVPSGLKRLPPNKGKDVVPGVLARGFMKRKVSD